MTIFFAGPWGSTRPRIRRRSSSRASPRGTPPRRCRPRCTSAGSPLPAPRPHLAASSTPAKGRELRVGESLALHAARRGRIEGRQVPEPAFQLEDLHELVEKPRVDPGGALELARSRCPASSARLSWYLRHVGRPAHRGQERFGVVRLEPVVTRGCLARHPADAPHLHPPEPLLPRGCGRCARSPWSRPTAFICTPSVSSTSGNFSKAKRGNFTTT